MKILNLIPALLISGAALFSSCTKIDEPYATAHHGNITDTVMNWDTVVPVKKVLLEDYTGHFCTNCPDAALIARTLEETHQGTLLVMAVHAGFYARMGTGDYALDLQSAEGTAWNNDFNITSNPNGMVNRKEIDGNRIIPPDKWESTVNTLLAESPVAHIRIEPEIDTNTLKITPRVYCHFISALPGSYKLTVCVLESSILGAQKNNNSAIGPTPDWLDYEFDDVMRGSLNGANGELLTADADPALTYMGVFNYTLDDTWKYKNCSLLAFIYNSETLEIVQAEKVKLLP